MNRENRRLNVNKKMVEKSFRDLNHLLNDLLVGVHLL
jgi:hypothetical protein